MSYYTMWWLSEFGLTSPVVDFVLADIPKYFTGESYYWILQPGGATYHNKLHPWPDRTRPFKQRSW